MSAVLDPQDVHDHDDHHGPKRGFLPRRCGRAGARHTGGGPAGESIGDTS